MIGVSDLQSIIADTFFSGNLTSAGLVMYGIVLAMVFTILSKWSMTASLVAVIPVTLIASMLGIISSDLMILILIVSLLGLALYSKVSVSWDPLEGRDGWGRKR